MQSLTFIFDYAEVLARASSDADDSRMAAELGLTLAAFRDRYWRHRNAYDLGGRADEFWSDVSGQDMSHPSRATLLAELVSQDIAAWTHLDETAVAVVTSLRAQGYRIVLLSNLPSELGAAVRQGPLAALFNPMVFSSEIGVAKPDPQIFRQVLDTLGVQAQSAVFVDDRPANLIAAATVGIHAVPFDGSHRLAEQMARWIEPRAGAGSLSRD